MREVIYVDNLKGNENPIQFTHYLDAVKKEWETNQHHVNSVGDIYYMGRDPVDGDLFFAKDGKFIRIYKGHLNSGKY